jgi:hypothetical protein
MTPVFAARRRAEEFASLVEAPSTRGSGDARYDDLLRVVGTLRDADPVTARPEFVADLRERLLTAADTVLVPSGTTKVPTETDRLTLPPRRSARERRIAAVVGGLALVGATTSMAVAAQDALPGEALYPVKRAMENAQTGLQFSEADKGAILLASASGRLDEVGALSENASDEDTIAIADTLDTFTAQASEASDLLLADYADNDNQASVSELRDFTAESLDQLTALEPQVPDDARDELVSAARVLLDIDAAAQQACPICGGSGITEIPRIFARTPADFTVPTPSGSTASVPTPPSSTAQAPDKEKPGGKAPQEEPSGGAPAVPTVEPAELPSGSVPQPPPTLAPDGDGQQAPPNDDPIGELTDQLGNAGSTGTSSPKSDPTPTPDLGDVADEVTEEVDDVIDGVGDTVDDKVDDKVDDTVDPLTGEVVP